MKKSETTQGTSTENDTIQETSSGSDTTQGTSNKNTIKGINSG